LIEIGEGVYNAKERNHQTASGETQEGDTSHFVHSKGGANETTNQDT
jgi:hypothetical protein